MKYKLLKDRTVLLIGAPSVSKAGEVFEGDRVEVGNVAELLRRRIIAPVEEAPEPKTTKELTTSTAPRLRGRKKRGDA